MHQSPLAEIRPLIMKAKRKKVSRPAPNKLTPNLATLDGFLEWPLTSQQLREALRERVWGLINTRSGCCSVRHRLVSRTDWENNSIINLVVFFKHAGISYLFFIYCVKFCAFPVWSVPYVECVYSCLFLCPSYSSCRDLINYSWCVFYML